MREQVLTVLLRGEEGVDHQGLLVLCLAGFQGVYVFFIYKKDTYIQHY